MAEAFDPLENGVIPARDQSSYTREPSDFWGGLDLAAMEESVKNVQKPVYQATPGAQLTPEQAAQVGDAPAAPTWMDGYKQFQADHVKQFGVDMNRPWDADADSERVKASLDQQYLDNLNAYNAKYGKNAQPDQSVFGIAAQPNTYTPTDHSHDGFFGGVAKSLGMSTNQLGGLAALAVGGWAVASAMAPTAAAATAAAPAASTAASTAAAAAPAAAASTAAAATAAPTGILESYLASPFAKPALGSALTYAKTGSIEKAALAGTGAYVGAQFVAPAVGGWAKDVLGASTAVSNVVGGAAGVVMQGGDPIKALESGAVGLAAGMITNTVPGFDNLGKATQSAINNAVGASLTGKSPSDALIASARNMAISMTADASLPSDVGPATKDFVADVAGKLLPQVGVTKKRKG